MFHEIVGTYTNFFFVFDLKCKFNWVSYIIIITFLLNLPALQHRHIDTHHPGIGILDMVSEAVSQARPCMGTCPSRPSNFLILHFIDSEIFTSSYFSISITGPVSSPYNCCSLGSGVEGAAPHSTGAFFLGKLGGPADSHSQSLDESVSKVFCDHLRKEGSLIYYLKTFC